MTLGLSPQMPDPLLANHRVLGVGAKEGGSLRGDLGPSGGGRWPFPYDGRMEALNSVSELKLNATGGKMIFQIYHLKGTGDDCSPS